MDSKGMALACCGLLLAGSAAAAPQYTSVEVAEGLFMTPALDVELEYDDNIFQSERNEQSSFVTRVAPALAWEARGERSSIVLGYGGDYGWFADSSDDNYNHHVGRLDIGLEGARTAFESYLSYAAASDPRGTGPSDALGDELARQIFTSPSKYRDFEWGANGTVGTRGTRARLTAGYDFSHREYQNFRQFTRERDLERQTFSLGFGYQLTGKTSAVVNASRTDVDYDFTPAGQAALDSTEHRVTAGIEWEATARTTGTVQLGWKEKDFDNPTRSDQDSFTWQANLAWSPRTYSTFSFYTENSFQEPDNVGSSKDVSTVGVSWEHDWNDRLRTTTGIDFSKEDFQGFDREDDFFRFSLAFDYDFQRWMTFGGGVRISSRDSDVVAADFDRNVIFVRAMMSL